MIGKLHLFSEWATTKNEVSSSFVRARLLTLHPHICLHFYICDAYADAGTTPNGPCL